MFQSILRGALAAAGFAIALPAMTIPASAAEYAVTTRMNVQYVEHDGVKLTGNLYSPKGRDKAPVIVAIHGGGWQVGAPSTYQHWGPLLAKNGYAVVAIRYRLMKPGVKTYPGAVYDVKAAIQYVRANASDLGVDPARIGLMGDSAGAHLAALVALACDESQFLSEYRNDPHAATPANVKVMVGFYGVYDMLAQWQHDQLSRPNDQIAAKFLGVSPMQNRRIYFDASPISYATIDRNALRVLLIHGTNDDIVDPETQSGAFLTALTQSGFFVRRIVLPGAGHFWSSDPFESEPHSYAAMAIPRMIRFLESSL